VLNALGIIIGGIAGITRKNGFSPETQNFLRVVIGASTVYVGLRLTWISLNGSFFQVLKQLGLVIVSMIIGKQIGRLLHLQHGSNKLGQFAKKKLEENSGKINNQGFLICAILFSVAPMAILGAVEEGMSGYFWTLAVKAFLDALAMLTFVRMLGFTTVLCFIPVLAFEGFIFLACKAIQPTLLHYGLIDNLQATGGLLVFCVSLVILELKKIEITDYLPSLAVAPLLTWLLNRI
jgi:uncharacterized membrane protein YqgA involved in biofilm formation